MIETVTHDGLWTVYLLHFDQPVSGRRHYIGITTSDRLHKRMLEHTAGRGAKLTTAAHRQGKPWRLARYWRTNDPGLEGALISRAEARQACPVCRGLATGIPYRPTQKDPRQAGGLRAKVELTSRGVCGDLPSSVHEKGEDQMALPLSLFLGQD